MKLIELLELIDDTAREEGISQPFICGGLARDKAVSQIVKLNDIDIMTGYPDVKLLANKVFIKLKPYNPKYITAKDGHVSLIINKLKIDFSSNFIIPNLDKLTGKKLSNIHQEMISRDFTCNTLLMSMDLKTIYDPLKKGISAIKNKQIDTCLDPDITFRSKINRVARAIYLSSKLGFELSPRVEKWIIKNRELVRLIPQQYAVEKINKALHFNYDNTIKLIKKLQLENFLPLNYINFKATI